MQLPQSMKVVPPKLPSALLAWSFLLRLLWSQMQSTAKPPRGASASMTPGLRPV